MIAVNRSTMTLRRFRNIHPSMSQQQSFSTFFPFGTKATTKSEKSTQQLNFSTEAESSKLKPAIRKADIVKEIANNHDLTLAASQRILDTVLDTIVEAVGEDKRVVITGFGVFDSYMSKERIGVNPGSQEKITIPSKLRIRFKASKAFKKGSS
jgi:DNA-binding protein HU-beta